MSIKLHTELSRESFVVTFNDVSTYPKAVGIYVESPKFGSWSVRFYYGGFDQSSKDYCSTYLVYSGQGSIHASFEASLLRAVKVTKVSPVEVFKAANNSHGVNCFVPSSHLNAVNLSFMITIMTYHELNISSNEPRSKKPRFSIADDTSKLLFSPFLSDVTIKVGVELIPAHKFVLCMRSEIFTAMFKSEMVETITNVIEITDFEVNVVKELLRFMYTDESRSEVLSQYYEQLLAVSCKYQVGGLVRECEEFLMTTFTVDNALPLLLLADNFSTITLKKFAIKFIVANAKSVMGQSDFFAKVGSTLSKELLMEMSGLQA